MDTHIVVMGDLIGSSRLAEADRVKLQAELRDWLDDLQNRLRGLLLTDASITAGDAFQLVVVNAETVADIAWEVLSAPEGIDLRLGVGHGEIFGEFVSDSRFMDGPAFRNAREAVSMDAQRIRLQGFGSDSDPILNGIAALLDAHIAGLTSKQRRVIQLVHDGLTGIEIARSIGVTPQAVSRFIQAAHWSEFESGERAFRKALALFAQRGPSGMGESK